MDHVPTTLDAVEQWLKVIALVAGGAFFAWKLLTGWLIINLRMSLKLERSAKSPDIDYLGITLTLEKGTTDSIWLQHITARANWPNRVNPEPIDMSDELRWLKVCDNSIVWGNYNSSYGKIALSPGESTTVARVTEVPVDTPVTVEVAAFGARALWRRGFQWRASAVSLPRDTCVKATTPTPANRADV